MYVNAVHCCLMPSLNDDWEVSLPPLQSVKQQGGMPGHGLQWGLCCGSLGPWQGSAAGHSAEHFTAMTSPAPSAIAGIVFACDMWMAGRGWVGNEERVCCSGAGDLTSVLKPKVISRGSRFSTQMDGWEAPHQRAFCLAWCKQVK